ncbi:MAG: endonuclease III [Proteobacteria bacterium]|nr:endonuclease III [Pseudomonadota bacterium]
MNRSTLKKKSNLLKSTEIERLFAILSKHRPDPRIELDYTNPYTLLVAVILSAQSTDKGVNKATARLFAIADSPVKMIKLGEEGLKAYIKSIGLYNSKARNIIMMSQQLLERFNGEVVEDFEGLCGLAGVGRKSANVIMNTVFGHPTIAVDTHIFRVSNRLGLCVSKTPVQTERALLKVVPLKWAHNAHHWLVLHGRYICKAKKPLCHDCPVAEICKHPVFTTGLKKEQISV